MCFSLPQLFVLLAVLSVAVCVIRARCVKKADLRLILYPCVIKYSLLFSSFLCLSVCLSGCLSVSLSVSACLSHTVSVCLSVSLALPPSLSPSLFPTPSLFIPLSPSPPLLSKNGPLVKGEGYMFKDSVPHQLPLGNKVYSLSLLECRETERQTDRQTEKKSRVLSASDYQSKT